MLEFLLTFTIIPISLADLMLFSSIKRHLLSDMIPLSNAHTEIFPAWDTFWPYPDLFYIEKVVGEIKFTKLLNLCDKE
jgi:hypothetical protein